MKAKLGILAFALAVIIIAVLGWQLLTLKMLQQGFAAQTQMFVLKFGKKDVSGTTEYAELKEEGTFLPFLTALCSKKAQFEIEFKRNDSLSNLCCDINTWQIRPCPPSKKDGSGGESVANDPHATYRVRSNDPKDIQAVLDQFKEPSPTPSPASL